MKRTTLSTTLAAALLPLASAHADALLFPYVASSDTVATIISVVNKDPSGQLFLNYFTKNSLANTASCTNQLRNEIDSDTNDLVSFEANGKFAGSVPSATGGPLFNDPATGDANYAGDNFTMGPLTVPRRGFLIVDDNDNDGEDLYGEALVLETLGGAAWGYRAFNPTDDAGPTNPEFDAVVGMGTQNDVLGEVLDPQTNTDQAAVTLLPTNEWETRFFVTPVSPFNQRDCEDCNASIRLTRDKPGSLDGLYDRDGNPLIGSNKVEVVCVSGVSLAELVPASAQATVGTQGGWGYINVDPGGTGVDSVPGAIVIKLEFNRGQSISPSASNSFVGTVNTAVWLQNSGNTQGTSGF